MLKVEYLKEGSPDCPLIRIYGENINLYKLLFDEINLLINHKVPVVHLQSLKGFKLVNIESFNLFVDIKNIGIIKISERHFECRLNIDEKQGWRNFIGLIEPFYREKPEKRFQWIIDFSEVKLLISGDGQW